MSPEDPSDILSDLQTAVKFVRRAVIKTGVKEEELVADQIVDDGDPICTLARLTTRLEKALSEQARNNNYTDVLASKLKCSTCGATSVGLDGHSVSSSSTQRSSEEPRKVSEEEYPEDSDEKCSSIGSNRIESTDSVSSADAFEHPVRSVSSSVSAHDEEETTVIAGNATVEAVESTNDNDLVIQTILSAVKQDVPADQPMDPTLLDQFLQNSLLGLTGNQMQEEVKIETPSSEENEEDASNAILSSFFQQFFANQSTNGGVMDSGSSENGTDSVQHSPPDGTLESMAMIESLLAESAALIEASGVSETKAAARKRKSTPMKVPKTENGNGYICPMEGCNKVFKEKGSVHRHFVTHIGMRFSCDQCKASYTQKHALMLHQKIHANPDAYQCRGCGTNYTTQNGLRLHRQRNPTCMEVANAMDFNNSLNKAATPNKMVSAP